MHSYLLTKNFLDPDFETQIIYNFKLNLLITRYSEYFLRNF